VAYRQNAVNIEWRSSRHGDALKYAKPSKQFT
jgi:hypothetical protein